MKYIFYFIFSYNKNTYELMSLSIYDDGVEPQ